MSVNEEGSMHIHPLLALPLLISVGAASVAAQSSSVKNPSLSAPPQSAPSSIRIDRLQLPFQGDRNDLSKTVPGAIGGGEHSTIIPPLPLYAIAPLEDLKLAPSILRSGRATSVIPSEVIASLVTIRSPTQRDLRVIPLFHLSARRSVSCEKRW